jgi:cupin 2 domain-containing protein
MNAVNVFDLSAAPPSDKETFERLAKGEGLVIERIVSSGQKTPEGEWYDQERDEWVVLLQGQATLSFQDGTELNMCAGDSLFIPAHQRHRVEHTSKDPPCIWIAVHATMKPC